MVSIAKAIALDLGISVFGDVEDACSEQQLQYILDLLVKLVFESPEAVLKTIDFKRIECGNIVFRRVFPGSVLKTTNITICLSQTYSLTSVIGLSSSWKSRSPLAGLYLWILERWRSKCDHHTLRTALFCCCFLASSTTVFGACKPFYGRCAAFLGSSGLP